MQGVELVGIVAQWASMCGLLPDGSNPQWQQLEDLFNGYMSRNPPTSTPSERSQFPTTNAYAVRNKELLTQIASLVKELGNDNLECAVECMGRSNVEAIKYKRDLVVRQLQA